jgi:hypothetical protein
MRLRRQSFLVFLISFPVYACSTKDSMSEEAAEALLVRLDAQDVTRSEFKGTLQVRYSVVEKYTAKLVIDWLSAELGRKGWKPLEYDFLDLRIQLSHVTG